MGGRGLSLDENFLRRDIKVRRFLLNRLNTILAECRPEWSDIKKWEMKNLIR